MNAYLTIANVVDHPDPKVRGKIAHVAGREVFTTGTTDGELVLYIPSGSVLSEKFALSHDLLRKHPLTGEKLGGYLEESRRVRPIKLRDVHSDGIVIPVRSLNGILKPMPGEKRDAPKTNDEVREVNTIVIDGAEEVFIRRYETAATKRQRLSGVRVNTPERFHHFRRHYDTGHWAVNGKFVPARSAMYITEKLHGTSARIGLVLAEVDGRPTFWQRLFRRTPAPVREYRYFNGTRNTVLYMGREPHQLCGMERYRAEWFNRLAPLLHRGETLYGEIVGLGIQKGFDYGCRPRETKFFLYRATMTNEDGVVTELSWPQVEGRAKQLGIPTVPVLRRYMVVECARPVIDKRVRELADGQSTVEGATHIREGVCVRYESPDTMKALKHKSFAFLGIEDKTKDDPDHVDIEEAS